MLFMSSVSPFSKLLNLIYAPIKLVSEVTVILRTELCVVVLKYLQTLCHSKSFMHTCPSELFVTNLQTFPFQLSGQQPASALAHGYICEKAKQNKKTCELVVNMYNTISFLVCPLDAHFFSYLYIQDTPIKTVAIK